MDLELDSGVIQNPTKDQIRSRVTTGLSAILSSDPLTFLQCTRLRSDADRYFLEYQEGSVEQHFRVAGEPVGSDAVTGAFVAYLEGDPSWRTRFQWQKIDPGLRARTGGAMNKPASPESRPVVGYLEKVWRRSDVRLQGYEHPTERWMVDVAHAADSPVPGVTSYSTVGLSRWPNPAFSEPTNAGVEICGACVTEARLFPNTLATAAFRMMRDNWACRPGNVLAGALAQYGISLKLPHLYFTVPFLWGNDSMEMAVEGQRVLWLLGYPISEAERQYLHRNGDDALESLFEQRQIDILDIERPSVV